MHSKVCDGITNPFPNINSLDKKFHPPLFNGCTYVSILVLALNRASKKGRWCWRYTPFYCAGGRTLCPYQDHRLYFPTHSWSIQSISLPKTCLKVHELSKNDLVIEMQYFLCHIIFFQCKYFCMTPSISLQYGCYCLQGAVSIRKTVLPGMAIPMLKIRRPNGRLIFNMEIAIRR